LRTILLDTARFKCHIRYTTISIVMNTLITKENVSLGLLCSVQIDVYCSLRCRDRKPNPNHVKSSQLSTDCDILKTTTYPYRYSIQDQVSDSLTPRTVFGEGEWTSSRRQHSKVAPKPTSGLASPHQTHLRTPHPSAFTRCPTTSPPIMIERASNTTCTAASHRHR
jgi:hypothetical protein